MESIISFFESNPWFNFISFLLGVAGVILAFVFYYKSKKERRLVYSKQTVQVIRPHLKSYQKLEILYGESKIDTMSVTKLAFWNAGRETIRGSDIVPSNPLKVYSMNGIEIFDFSIPFQSAENKFCVVKTDENTLKIEFDYLDYNDGIVLDVFHSGRQSGEIVMGGKIIGVKEIQAGIKKDSLSGKFDRFFAPVNYLLNKKGLLRVFGMVLAFVSGAILMPLAIVVLPIEAVYERFYNSHPKQFVLSDGAEGIGLKLD